MKKNNGVRVLIVTCEDRRTEMNRTSSKKYVCESDTRMTVVRIDFKKNVKKVERGHVRGTKRRKRKESKLLL